MLDAHWCIRRKATLISHFGLQAILFVRDLDTSLLGQNELGLENFDHLRKCTDELVNAILHVRQLLKRRRKQSGADGEILMSKYSVQGACNL